MSKEYWDNRYKTETTGWDVGYPTPPIRDYVDHIKDKSSRVLIPGAGNAYEAEYMHNQGFTNVFVLDISRHPLDELKKRVPDFPEEHLIHGDFFDLEDQFDYILEQTFFCALPPTMRDSYVEKMAQLLEPEGRLAGLLFSFPLTEQGPPFGGSEEEYRSRFSGKLKVISMEASINSITPRAGNELFFECKLP